MKLPRFDPTKIKVCEGEVPEKPGIIQRTLSRLQERAKLLRGGETLGD